ncbi:acyltransferase family protein [Alteromonas antoniana]|uniref:acyltransferase family protein n=1 Tax=Alteromonas antoniana TaxID=2803813 RepID=UPI001C43FD6B|nr:acyltransferase [Alteromonas antoniana]
MDMQPDRSQIIAIQYLRGIAALMVVVHHARNPKPWLYNPLEHYQAFAWGVDIFFVISGFIMYLVARNDNPLTFLEKRIIRIVPLYWATTLFLLLLSVQFKIWTLDQNTLIHVLQSLFFIPHYSPTVPDRIWPFLILGWTLNYEMLFYCIFALGLLFRQTLAVSLVSIICLAFAGVWLTSDSALLTAYTQPIILEFIAGMLIASLYVAKTLSPKLGGLALVGFAGLMSLPAFGYSEDATVVMAGRIVSSALIVFGTVSVGSRLGFSKLFHEIGNASYSIYLTHGIALVISNVVWSKVPITGWLQFGGKLIIALVISIMTGIAIYYYVEKPLLRWLRSRSKNIKGRFAHLRKRLV